MAVHPLDGAFERVNRAKEHLDDLKRGIEAFRVSQEEATLRNLDPRTHQPHPRQLDPIPLRFSVLIGEICYNCRSAMDYLVFELACLDSGVHQDGTQFPIESSAKGFRRQIGTGRLRGINASHVAALEALQPYKGCNWTKTLKDISNPDKHRQLIVTSSISGVATTFGPTVESLGTDGMIISATTEWGHQMHMKHEVTLTIELPNWMTVQALDEIQSQVAQALVDFQPEFK
jgi:hypothetical protein